MNWKDHPHRAALLGEVHARPSESVSAPIRVNHLVFLVDRGAGSVDREHLQKLVTADPLASRRLVGNHASVEIGGVRIRWERHTEFVSYTFLLPLSPDTPFERNAYDDLDPQWLSEIPGRLLSAQRVDVVIADVESAVALGRQQLDVTSIVGAGIADNEYVLLTDFRAREHDTVHYLLGVPMNHRPRRLGRYVQRVLEIETYRMMALLGLPDARLASAQLEVAERSLAELSVRLRNATREDEASLLDDITALATEVESIFANSHSRFSASAAYYSLVSARVSELHELALPTLQTLHQFLDRRLSPAMKTCAATNQRLENLSRRIANVSELLRTRVGIEQSESQYALLSTMTERQRVQLLMQSTVEGLSVAAITYYTAGLVSYVAQAAQSFGWPYPPYVTVASLVPVIALAIWFGMRRLHKRVEDAIRD